MSAHPVSWTGQDVPYSERFGDHFYSNDDGLAECRHVYLDGNELPARWHGAQNFAIAELGFGTGLNFLETWRLWTKVRQPGASLMFTSFEAYPVSAADMARAHERWRDLRPYSERLVEVCRSALATGTEHWQLDAQTKLNIQTGLAASSVSLWEGKADAWFLDGFAPPKNPEMWSRDVAAAVFARTKPGGTIAAYTAAGWVRRNFQAAGFSVSRRPGFGRKRHMMTGHRPDGTS